MVQIGADVHATDTYGNTPLERAVLDARQVLPRNRHNEPGWVGDKPLNPALESDLRHIFGLLFTRGALPDETFDRHTEQTLTETYRGEPVGRFIAEARR
jgi:hypothetical protein